MPGLQQLYFLATSYSELAAAVLLLTTGFTDHESMIFIPLYLVT